MSVCTRYTKDSEQVMTNLNDAFFKILSNLHKYQPDGSFEGWAKRIAINQAIDNFRRSNAFKLDVQHLDFSDRSLSSVDMGASDLSDLDLDADRLLAMINELPTMTAKVFNLFAIDGFHHDEISTMLGMTSGTSRWHVNRARELLKEKFSRINKATTNY